jgi:hypothetical protein
VPIAVIGMTMSCASGRQGVETAERSVAGCYRIDVRNWRPLLDLRNDAIFLKPPAVVELVDEPTPSRLLRGGSVMRAAPGIEPTVHQHQAWFRSGAQGLRLIWTTGFSGVEAELEPVGEGRYEGRAHSRWDFERQRQTSEISATPVSCGPQPE